MTPSSDFDLDRTQADAGAATLTDEANFGVRGFWVQRFMAKLEYHYPEFHRQARGLLSIHADVSGVAVMPIGHAFDVMLFVERSIGRLAYEKLWTDTLKSEAAGPFLGRAFRAAVRLPTDPLGFLVRYIPTAWRSTFPGGPVPKATLSPPMLTFDGGFGVSADREEIFASGIVGAFRAIPLLCGRTDIYIGRQRSRDGTLRILFEVGQPSTTEEVPVVGNGKTPPVL